MCTKRIVEKNFMGLGFKTSWICNKPEYKDGLCKGHFDAKIRKAIPFGQRQGYREPTLEELKSGKLVHHKSMGSHGGFRYKKGVIVFFNTGTTTKYPIDTTLFVIKIK